MAAAHSWSEHLQHFVREDVHKPRVKSHSPAGAEQKLNLAALPGAAGELWARQELKDRANTYFG